MKPYKNVPRRHSKIHGLKQGASGCFELTNADRIPYRDAVWAMYTKTYQAMGLIHSRPGELFEYDHWEVCQEEGQPVFFVLMKRTPFGLKSGLSGSDGSSQGKVRALNRLRTSFQKPGVYGEVSHKVEAIVLASGAPVVCARHVPKVLGKLVDVLEDGLHYMRSLSSVGRVTKIMVGRPRGIPVTDQKNPVCMPLGLSRIALNGDGCDLVDGAFHHACLLFE